MYMKKLLLVALVICITSTTGCALFMKPVINESRDNLVTQLKIDGIIVDKVAYMDMIDGKAVPVVKVPQDLIGKYYLPSKYVDIKDNTATLKVPEKSALAK